MLRLGKLFLYIFRWQINSISSRICDTGSWEYNDYKKRWICRGPLFLSIAFKTVQYRSASSLVSLLIRSCGEGLFIVSILLLLFKFFASCQKQHELRPLCNHSLRASSSFGGVARSHARAAREGRRECVRSSLLASSLCDKKNKIFKK